MGIWGNVVEGIHVASSDPYIFQYVSLLNYEFRRLLQQSNHCLLINFENMDIISCSHRILDLFRWLLGPLFHLKCWAQIIFVIAFRTCSLAKRIQLCPPPLCMVGGEELSPRIFVLEPQGLVLENIVLCLVWYGYTNIYGNSKHNSVFLAHLVIFKHVHVSLLVTSVCYAQFIFES